MDNIIQHPNPGGKQVCDGGLPGCYGFRRHPHRWCSSCSKLMRQQAAADIRAAAKTGGRRPSAEAQAQAAGWCPACSTLADLRDAPAEGCAGHPCAGSRPLNPGNSHTPLQYRGTDGRMWRAG